MKKRFNGGVLDILGGNKFIHGGNRRVHQAEDGESNKVLWDQRVTSCHATMDFLHLTASN